MNKNFIALISVYVTFSTVNAQDYEWAKSYNSTSEVQTSGIVVSNQGDVYTVGEFSGTADFDPSIGVYNLTSFGSFDCFITKLDIDGNLLWAKQLDGGNPDYCRAIGIDNTGNIYVTGSFHGTADFDPSGSGLSTFGGRV